MKRSDSIVIRLTALVFILLFLTIAILLILVNNQMNNHFSQYLTNMSHMMGNSQMGMGNGQYARIDARSGREYLYFGRPPVTYCGSALA